MLGTHSKLRRDQMSHICDISPLRVIPKSLITKYDNFHCIREYGSTQYIGMVWIKKNGCHQCFDTCAHIIFDTKCFYHKQFLLDD